MKWSTYLPITVMTAIITFGCNTSKELAINPDKNLKPELFVNLGETIKVPDGLAKDQDGNIYLAVPNFTEYEKWGSKIVKINKNRKMTTWFSDLPKLKETNGVYPMGLEFGPDGNLYIADNQYFYNKNNKSRLLRVNIKDGKPTDCEVVIEGFKLANAVRWYKNQVFVSDTFFDLKDKKNQSGVYRFNLSELNGKTIKLIPDAKDPHLVAQYTAKDTGEGETAGADGVCLDNQGNLYCGNFGDGVISKTTFNCDGSVKSQEELINHPSLECCDGIVFDSTKELIYIVNSKINAIHCYDVKNHSLCKLWENDDDCGKNGLLDQPCEPLLFGDSLIITNMDFPVPGMKNSENDKHNTLSVIKLN